MRYRDLGLGLASLIVLSAWSGWAQQPRPPAPPKPGKKPADKAAEKPKDDKKAPPEDKVVQTRHTARIGGQEIKYTATTGTLVMKTEEGDPKATVFYVA